MKHVIRKQVISLQLNTEHNAFVVQQQAKDYFNDHIVPVLEKVLDEVSSPDESIILDKLEIDLGDFMADSDHVYRILKQSFAGIIYRVKNNVTITSVEKHACQQWIYYMENGALPWA